MESQRNVKSHNITEKENKTLNDASRSIVNTFLSTTEIIDKLRNSEGIKALLYDTLLEKNFRPRKKLVYHDKKEFARNLEKLEEIRNRRDGGDAPTSEQEKVLLKTKTQNPGFKYRISDRLEYLAQPKKDMSIVAREMEMAQKKKEKAAFKTHPKLIMSSKRASGRRKRSNVIPDLKDAEFKREEIAAKIGDAPKTEVLTKANIEKPKFKYKISDRIEFLAQPKKDIVKIIWEQLTPEEREELKPKKKIPITEYLPLDEWRKKPKRPHKVPEKKQNGGSNEQVNSNENKSCAEKQKEAHLLQAETEKCQVPGEQSKEVDKQHGNANSIKRNVSQKQCKKESMNFSKRTGQQKATTRKEVCLSEDKKYANEDDHTPDCKKDMEPVDDHLTKDLFSCLNDKDTDSPVKVADALPGKETSLIATTLSKENIASERPPEEDWETLSEASEDSDSNKNLHSMFMDDMSVQLNEDVSVTLNTQLFCPPMEGSPSSPSDTKQCVFPAELTDKDKLLLPCDKSAPGYTSEGNSPASNDNESRKSATERSVYSSDDEASRSESSPLSGGEGTSHPNEDSSSLSSEVEILEELEGEPDNEDVKSANSSLKDHNDRQEEIGEASSENPDKEAAQQVMEAEREPTEVDGVCVAAIDLGTSSLEVLIKPKRPRKVRSKHFQRLKYFLIRKMLKKDK